MKSRHITSSWPSFIRCPISAKYRKHTYVVITLAQAADWSGPYVVRISKHFLHIWFRGHIWKWPGSDDVIRWLSKWPLSRRISGWHHSSVPGRGLGCCKDSIHTALAPSLAMRWRYDSWQEESGLRVKLRLHGDGDVITVTDNDWLLNW